MNPLTRKPKVNPLSRRPRQQRLVMAVRGAAGSGKSHFARSLADAGLGRIAIFDTMGHIELVTPVAHIWYFRSLPNKIGYLLGLPTKKLDQIIYYERYAVIQPGIKEEDGINRLDFLTEEEYLDIVDKLPRENQLLDDNDPKKFIAKMGADALEMLLSRVKLDELSYELRHQAATDTSSKCPAAKTPTP